MVFWAPAGHWNGYAGSKNVVCNEVADAELDCSLGKFHEANDVVAWRRHPGENHMFHLDERRALYPIRAPHLRVTGVDGQKHQGSSLRQPHHHEVYRFKQY